VFKVGAFRKKWTRRIRIGRSFLAHGPSFLRSPMSASRAGSQVMFISQFERAEPFTRTVGLSIKPGKGYLRLGRGARK
jgi:hypothetical protein